MKKKKRGRWMAALLAATLFAGVLGGCGKTDTGNGPGGGSGSGDGGLQPQDIGQESGKGRYVETQEDLPEELADWSIVQMYKADDKLRLVATKAENGKTILREWEKQGDSFADVTQGWLSSLELACGDWLEVELVQGQGGVQYLYAGYVTGDAFMEHLWRGEGDTALEITPEKWTTVSEDTGGYEMVQGIGALDNGTVVAVSYSSVYLLSGEDGSVIEMEPMTSLYEGGVVTDGVNAYLRSSGGSGGSIEKRKDGKGSGAVNIPYPSGEASGDSGGVIDIGGTGSLALDALRDGTLIGAGEDGIFRLPAGDEQGQWELLVEGMETDFAMTDYWCLDFVALEDGKLYALFQTEGGTKLNRYEYDPDAVSEVTEVLKLYTVYESSLLKQAAAQYHKAHPEVRIDIQSAYPMYYYGETDYNAVYQNLNTMLMGDGAPDIVAMDHLGIDSYADKGLLEDLDGILRPMEESGELLSNITGAYVREDGKRYAVPLQFGFNMAIGRDISAADMGSMEALAGFLAGTGESYMGNRTVAELVDEFYPYFCAEIVREKQLDKEALGRYLDYLKAIGDNCGIIPSRPEEELACGMWELASQAKFALEEVKGFTDCMFPMSMVDYIKGDFTAFEGRFVPSMQMGICTKSQYTDTAMDFLQFALSQEVQDADYYSGFPVNRKSLEKLAAKDRSDYSAATMITSDDGGYIEFTSEAYPKETAQKLMAMCGTLDKPVKEDEKIREVLIESIGEFLAGTGSKEAAIRKVEDGLKMYLAE